jgi:DnaJ family protein C protein 9
LNESEISEESAVWNDYFRRMFPKVTVEAIEEFRIKYKGSEEERLDILKAYNRASGELKYIMECVMLAEEEDESRIVSIIVKAIENDEIPLLNKWTQSLSGKPLKKRSKAGKSIALDGSSKSKSSKKAAADENLAQIILSNRNRQSSAFASICSKYAGDSHFDDIPDEEFAAIQKKLKSKK